MVSGEGQLSHPSPRLVYILVFWLLKEESKELQDTYPKVKVVSQTTKRLICYLIQSVIVKHASMNITLRRGRKCFMGLELKIKE